MMAVILKILSIIGIVLLVVLAVLLGLLLLVLFFPITYRVSCRKDSEVLTARVRVKWLFGLIRANYDTPGDGMARVKLLFFTLWKSKIPPGDGKQESGGKPGKAEGSAGQKDGTETQPGSGTDQGGGGKPQSEDNAGQKDGVESQSGSSAEQGGTGKLQAEGSAGKKDGTETQTGSGTDQSGEGKPQSEDNAGQKDGVESQSGSSAEQHGTENPQTQTESPTGQSGDAKPQSESAADQNGDAEPETGSEQPQDSPRTLSEKIQFTIRGICDKIQTVKSLWREVGFYRELAANADTKDLISFVFGRVGKILRSIRPRRIRGELLVGTGAPDTTGYLCALYGIMMVRLPARFSFTPDFERKVLECDLKASGHVTLGVILWHGIRVLLLRKLWKTMDRFKKHKIGSRNPEPADQNSSVG